MKKILILSIVMMIFTTACGNGSSDVSDNNNSKGRKAYASRTALVFDGISIDTGILINGTQLAEGKKIKYVNAYKNGQVYIHSEYKKDGHNISKTMILTNDAYYTLLPEEKTGIKQNPDSAGRYMKENMIVSIIENSKEGFIDSGNMEIEDKYYEYEEFSDPQNKDSARMRFCFDDKKLIALVAVAKSNKDNEKYGIWLIDDISGNVDDRLFEVPTDYKISKK